MSVVKVEFVLALSVPTDCCIEDGSDSFAFVLPARDVGFWYFAHEGLVHEGHCSVPSTLQLY